MGRQWLQGSVIDFSVHEEEPSEYQEQKVLKDFSNEIQIRSDLASLMATVEDEDDSQGLDATDREEQYRLEKFGRSIQKNYPVTYSIGMTIASVALLRYYWLQALISVGMLGFYYAVVAMLSRRGKQISSSTKEENESSH